MVPGRIYSDPGRLFLDASQNARPKLLRLIVTIVYARTILWVGTIPCKIHQKTAPGNARLGFSRGPTTWASARVQSENRAVERARVSKAHVPAFSMANARHSPALSHVEYPGSRTMIRLVSFGGTGNCGLMQIVAITGKRRD